MYDRHAPGLLAFFGRRTYDSQVAADLTAETFAQAFAARKRFRNPGPGAATAWLYTIARRQLNRFIRRQRVESQWRQRFGMDELLVAPDALERAEELIDLGKVRDHVAEALPVSKATSARRSCCAWSTACPTPTRRDLPAAARRSCASA